MTDGSNTHTLALIFAVLFAGSVVCPRASLAGMIDTCVDSFSESMYDCSIAALRTAGFPQFASLATLAAFIIVDTTWLREEEPLSCCAFVGTAFRVAQMLGTVSEIVPTVH